MLRGFTISTVLHATVLAAAVLTWPQRKSECDRQIERLEREEPGLSQVDILMRLPQCASAIDVPIDIVDIGLVTDIAPVRKADVPPEEEPEETEPEEQPDPVEEDAEIVDEPPEEQPDEVNETRESEPQEEEVVVEDPEAEPEEEPEPEPKKEEPPKPKDKPKLIEKQKPKAEKDDLDFLNDFEDILKDKAQDQRKVAREEAPPPINKPVLKDVQEPRKGAGERRGNTASLQAAMRRQIGYCWNGIDDLPKDDQINVVIRVKLNLDGSLDGDARLVSPRSIPVGRRGVVVQRALTAVRQCANYQLPADDYDEWKDIEVTVGPLK
ncbi:MAG: hypothetical protein GYB49_11960 [Alphaproteobacteria bacterium]|nr:hypothetical protein [Hyphomonas sp.]MBR9807925.1 hypothetical protein [Alphaproteobacteria bacterium]|tara:strand:- start:2246 stop:3217 length:972 start_codon:yes stop_codon:yes gene_type:complete